MKTAIAIIAIVTVALSAIAIFWNVQLAAIYWGFTPATVGVKLSQPLAAPWWITPWTSMLIHGGWFHLFINMLMLVFVGSQVERVVGASGVVAAYLIGALVASAAQYLASPMSLIPMVGASGAISALFGLYALFFGRPKQVTKNQKANRWIHAAWLLATWVALQWMAGTLAGSEGILLATPAHIGGFIAGMLMQRPLLMWRYRKA